MRRKKDHPDQLVELRRDTRLLAQALRRRRLELRLLAWKMSRQGRAQSEIAEALGVSQGAVSKWLSLAREHGVAALRDRPEPGARSRLTPQQQKQLPKLLSRGASRYGFSDDVWTRDRVAEAMLREFGVRYCPSQIGRLLRQCGRRQSTQRRLGFVPSANKSD